MSNIEIVTQDDFADYEELRQSGITNMMSPDVRDLAGIDKETHRAIIEHYEELCAKWPAIRNLNNYEYDKDGRIDETEAAMTEAGEFNFNEGV